MKVHILPQKAAVTYLLSEGSKNVLIRIVSEGQEFIPLKTSNQYMDILSLKFDDVTEEMLARMEEKDKVDIKLFDSEDAMVILDFFKKQKVIDHLVIHCEGGISRSAAVGYALCKYHNRLKECEKIWNDYIPNHHIVNKILSLFSSEKVEQKIPDNIPEEFVW